MNGTALTNRLLWAGMVTLIIFAGEVIGGIMSNSLALLSDAGHVLIDGLSLGLSLAAGMIMRRAPDHRATFGYQRIGLLAALINGISLVLIAAFIFVEAYRRFGSPPDVDSTLMLGIAAAGFAGNLLMAWILGGSHHDLNVRSAWLHVIGDTLSSAGVIVAALIIHFTGWTVADTIVSGLVGGLIIVSGVRLLRDTLGIFLEWCPPGFHPDEMSKLIAAVPGVKDVHDLHIWSIGHEIPAFSAHVQIWDANREDADAIRKRIEQRLREAGIAHSVIQMECVECDTNSLCCTVSTSNKDA